MSELQRYRSFVLTYNATTQDFEVGNTARIWVFSEGASTVNTQSPGGGAGVTLNVYATGSFAINDFCQIGVAGAVRQVTGVGATTLTLGAVISGTTGTYTDGTRVLNIGTASNKSGSKAVVYSVDQDTATPHDWNTGPLTADSSGNYEFYASTGDYDVLIQDSASTDLYIEANITLFAVARSTALGLVYLASLTDDFAVGGNTLASSAFYVDESAELVYVGGSTAPLVTLDGTNAKVTINSAAAQPQLALINSTTFTNTLTTSHTTTRTFTLPDITGTAIVDAGTQTMSGAKTFTGGVTISTAALTISSATTISGTLTASNTVTVTGATTDNKRVLSRQGSTLTLTTGNLTGWGTSPAIEMDPAGVFTTPAASKDQRFSFTVTTGTTASPNPTIAITFADGTWSSAPHVMVVRNGGTASTANVLTWTVTPTALTITYNGTPSNGTTLPLTVFCWG